MSRTFQLWSKSGGLVAPVGIVLGTPVLGHAATEALRMCPVEIQGLVFNVFWEAFLNTCIIYFLQLEPVSEQAFPLVGRGGPIRCMTSRPLDARARSQRQDMEEVIHACQLYDLWIEISCASKEGKIGQLPPFPRICPFPHVNFWVRHCCNITTCTIVRANVELLHLGVIFWSQRLRNLWVGEGMEALETAINYWDDALAAYTSVSAGPLAVTTGDEAQFCEDLQRLVDQAYELQEQCELLFLDQRSVLFRTDSSNRMYSELHSAVTSSAESFVADLREFEEFAEFFPDVENLPLYQAAKAHFESGGAIPYSNQLRYMRLSPLCTAVSCALCVAVTIALCVFELTLRTEMVRCSSDVEFICKLHCIRLALTAMFREKANWQWLADTGRQILTDILIYGDKFYFSFYASCNVSIALPGSWETHLFLHVQFFTGEGGFGADYWPISAFGLASVFDPICKESVRRGD
uniref:Uncharacterized protein n=1 Tax=Timema poppense TaxID=170557 RepID=A0A7R9DHS6_TIMPO|nr:unnamed protein product [Timema poppensis]